MDHIWSKRAKNGQKSAKTLFLGNSTHMERKGCKEKNKNPSETSEPRSITWEQAKLDTANFLK